MGRIGSYALMNGVNIVSSRNFKSELFSSVATTSQTNISVVGNYTYSSVNNDEYMIVENEIMKIVSAVVNGDNTDIVVVRGSLNTIPATYDVGIEANSLQLLNLKSSQYKQMTEISATDLLGVNLANGHVRLNDSGIKWSPQLASREYDYKQFSLIYIFEETGGVSTKSFVGSAFKLSRDSRQKQTTIEFYDTFVKTYNNSPTNSKFYIDKTIEFVLNDLYGYDIVYKGGLDVDDFPLVSGFNTRSFESNKDLINWISKNTGTRINITNGTFELLNDLDPTKLSAPTSDIQEGLFEITGNESSFIKINKISADYTEKKPLVDIEDYKDSSGDIIYFGGDFEMDITDQSIEVIADGVFKTVWVDGLDNKYIKQGAKVILIDNSDGKEYVCNAVDFDGTKTQLAVGMDTFFGWSQCGWIEHLTGEELSENQNKTLADYKVIYPIRETPIVWRYTYGTEGNEKTLDLRVPLVPSLRVMTGIVSGDIGTKILTTTGNFNDFFNDNNLIYIGDNLDEYTIATIDSDTQITLVEALLVDYVNKDVFLENGILKKDSSFGVVTTSTSTFSGRVAEIDSIWDTDFDNATLECARLYRQNTSGVPIYVNTVKVGEYSVPNSSGGNDKKIKYESFDNSDFGLRINRSENLNYDFVSLLKNKMVIDYDASLNVAPYLATGTVMFFDSDNYDKIGVGDTFKLNSVPYTDDRYSMYSNNTLSTWTVQQMSNETSVIATDGISNTMTGTDAEVLGVNGIFLQFKAGQEILVDTESCIIKSIENSNKIIVETISSIHTDVGLTRVDYIVLVDFIYPTDIAGVNYECRIYDASKMIHLDTFSIRGNPIMEADAPQTIENLESQELYGEIEYKLDGKGLTDDGFKLLLDHLKNSYASTDTTNTRSKVEFEYSDGIEVFDIVTITENLYNGYDAQKCIILSKEVMWNDSAHRSYKYTAITVGEYKASAKNIQIKSTLNYLPLNQPKYTHSNITEGGNENIVIDNPVMSLTDEFTGETYNMTKIDKSVFTAKAKSAVTSINNSNTLTLKSIKDTDEQFDKLLAEGSNGFVQSDGEYINFRARERTYTNTGVTGTVDLSVNSSIIATSGTPTCQVGDMLKLSGSDGMIRYRSVSTIIGSAIGVNDAFEENFIASTIEVINVELEILRREVFGTTKSEIITDDVIVFYDISSQTTKDGLQSDKLVVGSSTIVSGDGVAFDGSFFNETAYVKNAREFIGAMKPNSKKIKVNNSGSVLKYDNTINATSGTQIVVATSGDSFLDIFEVGNLITLDNGANSEMREIGLINSATELVVTNNLTYGYSNNDLYLENTTDNIFYEMPIKDIQLRGLINLIDIDSIHIDGLSSGLDLRNIFGRWEDYNYTIDFNNNDINLRNCKVVGGIYHNIKTLEGGEFINCTSIKFETGGTVSSSGSIFNKSTINSTSTVSSLWHSKIIDSEATNILFTTGCKIYNSEISTSNTLGYLFNNCDIVEGNIIDCTNTTSIFGGVDSDFVQFNTAENFTTLGNTPTYEINNSWQIPYQDALVVAGNVAVVTTGMEFAGAILTSQQYINDETSTPVLNKYYEKTITDIYIGADIDLTGVEDGTLNTVGTIDKINNINIKSLKKVSGYKYILHLKTPSSECSWDMTGVSLDSITVECYRGMSGGLSNTAIVDSVIKLYVGISTTTPFANIKLQDTSIILEDGVGATDRSFAIFSGCKLREIEYSSSATTKVNTVNLFNSCLSVVNFKQLSNNANEITTVFSGAQCDLIEGVNLLGTYDVGVVPFRQSNNVWNINETLYSGTSTTATLSKPYTDYRSVGIEVRVKAGIYSYIELPSDSIVINREYFIGDFSENMTIKFTSTTSVIKSHDGDYVTRVIGVNNLGGTISGAVNPNYFDKTVDTLDNITNGGGNKYLNKIDNTFDTGTTTLATFDTANYLGAKYSYTISDGANFRAGDILVVSSGTATDIVDNSTPDIGDTSGVSFNTSISTGIVSLAVTSSTDGWAIKIIKFEI